MCLPLVTMLAPLAAQSAGGSGYHVARQIELGGDGRWDYIVFDTAAHRLFIARQTRVMVVDPESGRLLGEIPGLDGAHGIALVNETGHGFATSGRDRSVTMFDLETLRVLGRTKAAEDADAVLYDPVSKRVLTFNGDAGSSTVVDPVSGKAIGSIALGGKPEFGVSAGDGKVYVNLEDKARVAEIDAVGMRVTRSWSIAPCAEPTGLAIDRVHHRLFSACRNRLMAISDATAGSTIATVPIGEGVGGAAFDPATQLAFASNGDGSITVVHEDGPATFRVVATVPTRRGARTMALEERSHRLFTVTADFGPTLAATAEQPHPRPSLLPGSFGLLVLAR